MKLLEQTLTQLIIISLAGAPAAAASEYVRHQAHAHGIAELTIALEGNRLEMIFTSPAMSLVGFEGPSKVTPSGLCPWVWVEGLTVTGDA